VAAEDLDRRRIDVDGAARPLGLRLVLRDSYPTSVRVFTIGRLAASRSTRVDSVDVNW
jgi:hypothetical protein